MELSFYWQWIKSCKFPWIPRHVHDRVKKERDHYHSELNQAIALNRNLNAVVGRLLKETEK